MTPTTNYTTATARAYWGQLYLDFQPPVPVTVVLDIDGGGCCVYGDAIGARYYRTADELHVDVDGSAGVIVLAARFANWHIV
jgi:hypothetical protein